MQMQSPRVRALFGSIAACVAVVAAAAAWADAPPPPPSLPFSDLTWTAKVATQPAARLTMGQFQISFERTQLGEVVAAAGGVIAHQGDAGNSVRWLCYSFDGRKRHQQVWFLSSEMGGREQVITGIIAEVVKQPSRGCPALPVTLLPVSFNNGIWLGMPAAILTSIFATPPGRLGSWSGYRYEHKGDGTCKPNGFDVLNSLQWRTVGGGVESISAGQVSTC